MNLNRNIADYIEAKPTLNLFHANWDKLVETGVELKHANTYLGTLSPGKAWVWMGVASVNWQPREFDSDPACMVMLLEKMEWPELTRYNGLTQAGWMVVPNWDRPEIHAVAATISRAVAEAFAKAHGLEVE